jgi:hypothetical protein
MTAKTEGRISEAASEKRKRGRPPVFDPAYRSEIGGLFNEVTTHRGMTDCLYRQRAFNLLSKDGRFAWVADGPRSAAGAPDALKSSILVELGRIPNDEDLKAVALRICELKPKTKDAVSMIRRVRLGREAKGGYLKLCESLENALNAYLSGHPSTPADWPVKALRDVADCIEDGGTA